MGKDKLRKFRENETFRCMIQPATSEVLGCDHPIKGNWGRDFFGNDNPIVVELGCGKGDYTIDLAERNPSFNYIGVDIKGARLWKGAKYAEEHGLKNVAFLRTRIEFIESLFAEGEIAEIWITFADPQIGREKKRLYESGLSSLCGRAAVDALFEVQTFYESQYLAQGFQITYLSFVADHEGDYVSPQWDEDRWKDENHHFVIPSGLPVASKFYPEG